MPGVVRPSGEALTGWTVRNHLSPRILLVSPPDGAEKDRHVRCGHKRVHEAWAVDRDHARGGQRFLTGADRYWLPF